MTIYKKLRQALEMAGDIMYRNAEKRFGIA